MSCCSHRWKRWANRAAVGSCHLARKEFLRSKPSTQPHPKQNEQPHRPRESTAIEPKPRLQRAGTARALLNVVRDQPFAVRTRAIVDGCHHAHYSGAHVERAACSPAPLASSLFSYSPVPMASRPQMTGRPKSSLLSAKNTPNLSEQETVKNSEQTYSF
jgi:hypothetical protein